MRKNRSRTTILFIIILVLFFLTVSKDKLGNLLFPKQLNKPFSSVKTNTIKEIDVESNIKTTSIYNKVEKDFTE